MSAFITINNLSVASGDTRIIDNVSLLLSTKGSVTILGETGAGKSVLAQAIIGDLPNELNTSGDVIVNGVKMLSASKTQCRKMWGNDVMMLPQEPWRVLNPIMTIAKQIAEVFQFVKKDAQVQAKEKAYAALSQLALANDMEKIPSQLSGGMAQRVAFACANATNAKVFIADEPTKGLDAARKAEVIAQLKRRAKLGALLTITHDIDVATALGGTIMVLKQGRVVEVGNAQHILRAPQAEYTKALIGAAPHYWPTYKREHQSFPPLLSVKNVSLVRGTTSLLSKVNFTLGKGEIVGLCGESGSGKTSLGDALLGNLPYEGTIEYHTTLKRCEKLKLYQDPPSTFSPYKSLKSQITDVIKLHKLSPSLISALCTSISLDSALLDRTANQVSGGELQRIALLRVLLLKPALLIADEPTSRLDPITSKKITHLLVDQCRKMNCTTLLISHDREQLEKVCDRVIDMHSF